MILILFNTLILGYKNGMSDYEYEERMNKKLAKMLKIDNTNDGPSS